MKLSIASGGQSSVNPNVEQLIMGERLDIAIARESRVFRHLAELAYAPRLDSIEAEAWCGLVRALFVESIDAGGR